MDYFKKELVLWEDNSLFDINESCKELDFFVDSTSDKVSIIISCPNCDNSYNSEIWCSFCWYWINPNLGFLDEEVEIDRTIKNNKISEKNKWNWRKIQLISWSDIINYYHYNNRIWNGKALIEIWYLPTDKTKNTLSSKNIKPIKLRLYFQYYIKSNNVKRGESEWKIISNYKLLKLEKHNNGLWEDKNLSDYNVDNFLKHKIYNWKNITEIIFFEILSDYKYNSDLLLD